MGLGEAEPARAQPHRDDEGDRDDSRNEAPVLDESARRWRAPDKGGHAGRWDLGGRLGCGCAPCRQVGPTGPLFS